MLVPQTFLRPLILFCAISIITTLPGAAQTENGKTRDKTETIVCIRHGEKPPAGFGQLTCQGLNRALRLPQVLLTKFGKPDFIFAPDPNQVNHDPAGDFCYVRPLARIEPTAIQCGLPVNTHFGFTDIASLEQELSKPAYSAATVFVAWEHWYLDNFVKDMVKLSGGDPAQVPGWPENDFDSIFVVRLPHNKSGARATFTRDTEGLDNLSTECPNSSAHRARTEPSQEASRRDAKLEQRKAEISRQDLPATLRAALAIRYTECAT